jgi:hypothetical protein
MAGLSGTLLTCVRVLFSVLICGLAVRRVHVLDWGTFGVCELLHYFRV